MSDERLARCIFNGEAQKRFLGGEVNGLHFKLAKGVMYCHPTRKRHGANILVLDSLPSGRRSVDLSRTILNGHFVRVCKESGAFLILYGAPHGWIRIEHSQIASSSTPHCRIWRLKHTNGNDANQWKIIAAQQIILAAALVIQKFKIGKYVGRPPKELREARIVMASYDNIGIALAAIRVG